MLDFLLGMFIGSELSDSGPTRSYPQSIESEEEKKARKTAEDEEWSREYHQDELNTHGVDKDFACRGEDTFCRYNLRECHEEFTLESYKDFHNEVTNPNLDCRNFCPPHRHFISDLCGMHRGDFIMHDKYTGGTQYPLYEVLRKYWYKLIKHDKLEKTDENLRHMRDGYRDMIQELDDIDKRSRVKYNVPYLLRDYAKGRFK